MTTRATVLAAFDRALALAPNCLDAMRATAQSLELPLEEVAALLFERALFQPT